MLLRQCFLAVLVAATLLTMAAIPAQAQPGRGGPQGGFGGGMADLLRREEVRKELELVDDQIEQLSELGRGGFDSMRSAFSELRDLDQDERREKMRELFEKARKDTEDKINEILLPPQIDRLKQLVAQSRMRGGAARALAGDRMAEELGLSDTQKEKLQERAQKLEEEMRQKLTELRKEAQEKLLEVLTPAQRKKYEDMVGEPFEFQARQGGFQGRGGEGGQGRGRGGEGGQGRGRGN